MWRLYGDKSCRYNPISFFWLRNQNEPIVATLKKATGNYVKSQKSLGKRSRRPKKQKKELKLFIKLSHNICDSVLRKSGATTQKLSLFLEKPPIFRKPREGNRRAFMFLTAITLMISYTTAVETRTSKLAGVSSVNYGWFIGLFM